MAQEIKPTSSGVPYILEFENVSFVPKRPCEESRSKNIQNHDPHSSTGEPPSSETRYTFYTGSPSSSVSSFCYIESPPVPPRLPSFSFRAASSIFKRKNSQHSLHTHAIPLGASNDSTDRRPIWCADSDDVKPLPPPTRSDVSDIHGIFIRPPLEHGRTRMSRKERLVHLQQTISIAVLNAGMSRSPGNDGHLEKNSNENLKPMHGSRGYRTADALFCGTYGQLMSALEGAGLSATPCSRDQGSSAYTRLGALFVARNDGTSRVQLRKITLWG